MLETFLKSRILFVRYAIRCTQTKTFSYESRIRRLFNDGIDVKQQTVEINSIERIRRCTFYKDIDLWSFYKTICPNVRTLGDALTEGNIASNDGPCVGIVQSLNGKDSLQWLSYSKVIEQSRYIGSYLWRKTKLKPLQYKVAILSSNRSEYFFVEQACYMYGFIVVSLYTTYDSTTIMDVLKRTQAEILVVDNLERIKSIHNELLDNTDIKEIVALDDVIYDNHSKIRPLSSIFKTMEVEGICERPSIDPDDIATFVLTSGTTGEPKIAMLTHVNLLATARGHTMRMEKANIKRPLTDRHCVVLPMAHVYERFAILQCLLRGSQIVFCPAPEKVPNYLLLVKPTQACVVPRILNKIYDAVMMDVKESRMKQFLVQQALRGQSSFLSKIVFRKIRALFGNELQAMITGSAPITPEVMHFFRVALNIPAMEGYGQTESAGAGTTTHAIDLSYGTIGTPMPAIEIKLVDVPGTNYRSELNQGEICLCGPPVFKVKFNCYYGDEAKTHEVLDQDGWLHTGDVGEWTNNGTLRIIDRIKHIFKLSQGKYIAPERLEDIYIRSSWVAQIFVDGISSESTIVAIVIPDEQYVRKHFNSTTTQTSFVDLCKDEKLKQIILADLHQLAELHKFKIYEKISNIHLHPELLSQNNGLLTVTLKTRRTHARKHFQPIIQSLYKTNPPLSIDVITN